MSRRKRKGRPVDGVLLLDKPLGISSNSALQQVKNLYGAAKAGHTGSLDPLATGMLPICFGEATKISAFLLDADKRYRFTCQLGSTTSTGDAEGEVLETRDCSNIKLADVESVLPDFIGEIDQIPPMYSALKHNGQRLYKLAREGVEVERKPRTITIYDIVLHSLEGDLLDLEVQCSKGTYVRTLAEDIGEALGCGAHVAKLRRLSVGPYEGEMYTAEKLHELFDPSREALDQILLPIESGVANWPDVHLGADAAFYVGQGQPILVPNAPTEGWVRIYDQQKFLGVGEIQDDGLVAPRRMIQAPA
ncbi:MAG: tRNA pseudouridine(55) synthase TruB [Gammaproteobacteria bacterium]|nr:tRNA pseudouridine(55) synthase TruB [Gammaproteobacteria bacterium]